MHIYIINSLKDLPKSIKDNSLIITNSYELSSYLLKHSIEFKQFSEIINFYDCSKVNVHEYFTNWFDNSNIDHEYFQSLKYSLSNQIRVIELAKIFTFTICKNYTFDEVYISDNSTPTFKRENLEDFQLKIISFLLKLKNKKVVYLNNKSYVKDFFYNFLYTLLPFTVEIIYIIKNIFYTLNKITKNNYVDLKSSYDILSFCAGTDTTYISNILEEIKFFSILNIQSESKHDYKFSKFKENVHSSYFSLKNLTNIRQILKVDNNDIINLLSNNDSDINNFFRKYSFFIEYIKFRILYEGLQINMYKGIIKSLNPKVVISGSLYLPLIAANTLNIKTISVVEGLGIAENPVAPFYGNNVLSPNKFSVDQIAYQYKNSSYYIVGYEVFQ